MTLKGLAETLFDSIEKEGARAPRLSSEERGTVCRVLRGVVEVEGFSKLEETRRLDELSHFGFRRV